MAALSVRMVWDDFRFDETSPGIGVPQWWYSIWLPVISLAIAVRALGLFIRRSRARESQRMIATLLFIGLRGHDAGRACRSARRWAWPARPASHWPTGDAQWFGLLAVPQNFYAGLGKYPLLAIPMFVLVGSIFDRSGVAAAARQLCDCHRRARPGHAAAGGDCGGDVPGRHFGLGPGQRGGGGRA